MFNVQRNISVSVSFIWLKVYVQPLNKIFWNRRISRLTELYHERKKDYFYKLWRFQTFESINVLIFLMFEMFFFLCFRCLKSVTMKMGLTASPLRRRGCLLVLAFCILVPFTLMMLFVGPGKHSQFYYRSCQSNVPIDWSQTKVKLNYKNR